MTKGQNGHERVVSKLDEYVSNTKAQSSDESGILFAHSNEAEIARETEPIDGNESQIPSANEDVNLDNVIAELKANPTPRHDAIVKPVKGDDIKPDLSQREASEVNKSEAVLREKLGETPNIATAGARKTAKLKRRVDGIEQKAKNSMSSVPKKVFNKTNPDVKDFTLFTYIELISLLLAIVAIHIVSWIVAASALEVIYPEWTEDAWYKSFTVTAMAVFFPSILAIAGLHFTRHWLTPIWQKLSLIVSVFASLFYLVGFISIFVGVDHGPAISEMNDEDLETYSSTPNSDYITLNLLSFAARLFGEIGILFLLGFVVYDLLDKYRRKVMNPEYRVLKRTLKKCSRANRLLKKEADRILRINSMVSTTYTRVLGHIYSQLRLKLPNPIHPFITELKEAENVLRKAL